MWTRPYSGSTFNSAVHGGEAGTKPAKFGGQRNNFSYHQCFSTGDNGSNRTKSVLFN